MAQIDIERFYELEKEGLLFINRHEDAPLLIHNYTQKVQYERIWTPETILSRGLITDLQGNIVARPFGKFFNLEEHIEHVGPLPQEPFEVYEKMDGSLGIIYFIEGEPRIATRGSFGSEQSIKANEILREKYGHLTFDPSYTYLLEIIYPENRIVVDYGEKEDLVLLGVIEPKTGREVSLDDIDPGLPKVKRYDGINDLAQLRAVEEYNKEGYVIRFSGGLRVKVKFEEYVRLHRIIAGVSARVIWEFMMQGESIDEMLEKVPDEFYKWVKSVQVDLRSQFKTIEDETRSHYRELADRKETAAYFNSLPVNSKILFRMLDGKSYDDIIWRMIRPDHQTPFMREGEEDFNPSAEN